MLSPVGHTIVYRDPTYYAAFPSAVCRPDGELMVAFRRAPDRRRLHATSVTHCDPNSYLVMVRSDDGGQTWSHEPELIYAHPFGGSQDPCLNALDDGSLLLSSYAWMLVPPEEIEHGLGERGVRTHLWPFTFLGGYLLRSPGDGDRWEPAPLPPQLEHQTTHFPGVPVPAWNRGAMCQTSDGTLFWAVACSPRENPRTTCVELLASRDRGSTWHHLSTVARDAAVTFNETSLIETPAGDLVAFIRTANLDDHGVIARSRDRGHSWEPWQDTGIVGHPYHALTLPNRAVLLVYGYRHQPYGIRARALDPECRDWGAEIVLRDDGGTADLGYPWSCAVSENRFLVVYYFNLAGGTRHIAGTFLEFEKESRET
jgi:hypothetical protein